jgi:hypothetical protein
VLVQAITATAAHYLDPHSDHSVFDGCSEPDSFSDEPALLPGNLDAPLSIRQTLACLADLRKWRLVGGTPFVQRQRHRGVARLYTAASRPQDVESLFGIYQVAKIRQLFSGHGGIDSGYAESGDLIVPGLQAGQSHALSARLLSVGSRDAHSIRRHGLDLPA